MKFELGKCYETFSRRKAYYVGRNPAMEPVQGRHVLTLDDGRAFTVGDNGRHGSEYGHPLDIIGEWREPRGVTVDVYLCELEGKLHAACNDPRLVFRTYGNIVGVKRGITINEGDGMEEKQCSANW